MEKPTGTYTKEKKTLRIEKISGSEEKSHRLLQLLPLDSCGVLVLVLVLLLLLRPTAVFTQRQSGAQMTLLMVIDARKNAVTAFTGSSGRNNHNLCDAQEAAHTHTHTHVYMDKPAAALNVT